MHTLALADDCEDADGARILNYQQACTLAASSEHPAQRSALTVRDAIDNYIEHLRGEKGDGPADDAEAKLRVHVIDPEGDDRVLLADDLVADLTRAKLEKWRNSLVRKNDAEVERRSKSSANRTWAVLKAALNYSFNTQPERGPGRIETDRAWRTLKGFKDVDRAREAHYAEDDVRKLIDLTRPVEPHFADLLEAAFHTGARYGELVILDVRHFDPRTGQVTIPRGKTGPRVTTLTAEGAAFFARLAAGKKPDDMLFPRPDGTRWAKSQQQRPTQRALARADLVVKDGCFYALRHTYISRSIERNMPLTLVAENTGTSLAMIEKHYAKVLAQVRRGIIGTTGPRLRRIA